MLIDDGETQVLRFEDEYGLEGEPYVEEAEDGMDWWEPEPAEDEDDDEDGPDNDPNYAVGAPNFAGGKYRE